MRRCKAFIWEEGGKKVPVEGMFHQFANQYEDCGDAGIANYTVALIELDDGRIVEAPPDSVVFSEPAGQQPVWWMRTPVMPAVRSCETCGRSCKKTYPFSSNACEKWASRWAVGVDLSMEPDVGADAKGTIQCGAVDESGK